MARKQKGQVRRSAGILQRQRRVDTSEWISRAKPLGEGSAATVAGVLRLHGLCFTCLRGFLVLLTFGVGGDVERDLL